MWFWIVWIIGFIFCGSITIAAKYFNFNLFDDEVTLFVIYFAASLVPFVNIIFGICGLGHIIYEYFDE